MVKALDCIGFGALILSSLISRCWRENEDKNTELGLVYKTRKM